MQIDLLLARLNTFIYVVIINSLMWQIEETMWKQNNDKFGAGTWTKLR